MFTFLTYFPHATWGTLIGLSIAVNPGIGVLTAVIWGCWFFINQEDLY